jgi:hypothetical protein
MMAGFFQLPETEIRSRMGGVMLVRKSAGLQLYLLVLIGWWVAACGLHAGWQDEIGFTRLQDLAGPELPAAPLAGLTLVEAKESGVNYSPNTGLPAFAGKTFVLKSGPSGVSGHATHAADNFFGTTSVLPGACPVDLYSAGSWLGGDFLNESSTDFPLVEVRAVQSHSWIGSATTDEITRRLDFAIDRDGFVCVVGVNNGLANPLPHLLAQCYHTLSVGRDDGDHSAGFTTKDGNGRIKPEIVGPSASPENATSWTTPMVAGSAGLLHAKLSAAPYSLGGADLPRVVKALLLAGATRNTLPSWSNTSSRPLDLRYGAGELNLWHAYTTMRAGRVSGSPEMSHPPAAWAAEQVAGEAEKRYFFTIPAGAAGTPFCATLTWHRDIQSELTGEDPDWVRTWSASLADLNLRLHQADGFSEGALITASQSAVDNVELVHQAALAPGNYVLVVSNLSVDDTPYALAWHSLPAVGIAAAVPVAREIDGQPATLTISRTGDLSLPLRVPLVTGGTAIPGVHFLATPAAVTIPAGETSATLDVVPVSDELAQGERSVTFSIGADFTLVPAVASAAEVTIEDKPFDHWRFTHFSSVELADPLVSGELADPDSDGLPNLVEYALGLLPKTPQPNPLAPAEIGGRLAISVTKSPAATDITWLAKVSAELSGWLPAEIVTNDTTTFEARDIVPIVGNPRRFIRLEISRP